MISGVTVLAILGILSAVATLACRTLPGSVTRLEGGDTSASGALQVMARFCLGLSCLFAFIACGELWSSLQGREGGLDVPHASAWGALWVYVAALLVEWRRFGPSGAGGRAFAGWLLAGAGVLFLGIGLGSWSDVRLSAEAACADGTLALDAAGTLVGAVAALGLSLVPLAGMALRLARPERPPLAAAAASVVVSVWLQPVLPALGWLPLSRGGGALALLLAIALTVLGLTAGRGPGRTAGGLAAYFALSVGGCLVLGVL